MLQKKCIALNSYISSLILRAFFWVSILRNYRKFTYKPSERRKYILKIRAEINKIEKSKMKTFQKMKVDSEKKNWETTGKTDQEKYRNKY